MTFPEHRYLPFGDRLVVLTTSVISTGVIELPSSCRKLIDHTVGHVIESSRDVSGLRYGDVVLLRPMSGMVLEEDGTAELRLVPMMDVVCALNQVPTTPLSVRDLDHDPEGGER